MRRCRGRRPGSLRVRPPAMLRYTSLARVATPQRRSRTASSNCRRFTSTPRAVRFGYGKGRRACERLNFGCERARAFERHRYRDAGASKVGAVPVEAGSGRSLRRALCRTFRRFRALRCFRSGFFLGAQQAVRRVLLAGEEQDDVYEMFEQLRPRYLSLFCDVADEDCRY